MKNAFIVTVLAITVLGAGCGQKNGPAGNQSGTPSAVDPADVSPGVSEPALAAWQQGDKTAAVNGFVAANWSARKLFRTGSTLNLSEAQFKALSDTAREAKSADMMAQIESLRQLANAVTYAGRDAVIKGDGARARKCFEALKQCGLTLQGADRLSLEQIVGKGFERTANAESAKIPE